jgi:pimeloyl-CoA synthetase
MKHKIFYILLRITLVISIITTIIVCIALPKINKIKAENERLSNEVIRLNNELNVANLDLETDEFKIMGAGQEAEQLWLTNEGIAYELNELNKQYTITSIWNDMAEYILLKQGIEFLQVIE